MALLLLLLYSSSYISCLHGSEDVKQGSNILTVYPLTTAGHLVRRMDETLNLTCSVTGNSSHMNKFNISWVIPFTSKNSKSRVFMVQERNNLTLSVKNLQESDTGDYTCQAVDNNQTTLQEIIRVNVKRKKSTCSDNMFQCTTPVGECIHKRYTCDGRPDCSDGSDEAHCGRDACEGKLRCDNGRCIPYEWCCDDYIDPNCTVTFRLPCCRKLITGCVLCAAGDMDADGFPPSEQQRFNDMGFLQTTIYTVIGCAMAFMFIVTVLVIAICRVHMKRSMLSRCPGAMLASRTGPGGNFPAPLAGTRLLNLPRTTVPPLFDLDVFLSRSAELSQPAHSNLLVTYNINNGVQFVGRPVDPPPYSEIVSSPPREGPPPPYTSRENLAHPTVCVDEAEDNANEGDSLLGNSTREESPIIQLRSGTIPASVESSGEADSLLSSTNQAVLPSLDSSSDYVSSVPIVTENHASHFVSQSHGGQESSSTDSPSTESPDGSFNNSSSSEFSDQQSSFLTDTSISQIQPCVATPSSDECSQTSTAGIPSNEVSSGDQINSDNLFSSSSTLPNSSSCNEAEVKEQIGFEGMKGKNTNFNKDTFNSNLSRPVGPSHSLTNSPSTCKISMQENINSSLVDTLAIAGFPCEGNSVNEDSGDNMQKFEV